MGSRTKIGIYVFTNQLKERIVTDNDRYFEGKAFYGFRYILSELDSKKYEKVYVSNTNINSVDFVLISVTSFYDVYNIRKELKGKKVTAKVVIGGSGISNIESVYDIADVVVLGRFENRINSLLEGEEMPNVWRKEKDKNLIGKYVIEQPKQLISIDEYNEESVGCNNKCKFCQYGWKFELFPNMDQYKAGYNNREDMIQYLDFSLCNRKTAPRLNSAIDGFTEYTRERINKKIINEEITEKFKEIYNQKQPYFALKLYSIVGFSWENKVEIEEFYEAVEKADKNSDKKLNIFIISTHFVPMPFTPMENEPVNLHNFREEIKKKNFNRKGKSINIFYPHTQVPSPITAIEQTIINRIKKTELEKFDRVLLSSKYNSLKSKQKIKVIDKYFAGIYDRYDGNICPNVVRPFNYRNMP